MNQFPIPQAVLNSAHWLTTELFDELALDDPADMKPHFTGWLTGFRFVKDNLYHNCDAPTLLKRVRTEADRYYYAHLEQKHHTCEDKVFFCFALSRAMLQACDHFTRQPKNSPRTDSDQIEDLLTIEALHAGHYINLMDATQAMLWESGAIERAYNLNQSIQVSYEHCFLQN